MPGMTEREAQLAQFRLQGGGGLDLEPKYDRYQGGVDATVNKYRSEEASTQARLLRAARLLDSTPSAVIKKYGGSGTQKEKVQRAVDEAEKMMGDEYRTGGVNYDSHFGGTGVHLARPLEGLRSKGDQDTDAMLYAVKRFKRRVHDQLESAKRSKESESGELSSERPVQLVRSCEAAGPNWVHCDPLKDECPPAHLLVGTPYENVWSGEVGVPPNNVMGSCAPAELVRIGGAGKRDGDQSLNSRLHKAIQTIAAEGTNIHRLAKWRTKAPCGAIPPTALQAHPGTCDTMFFSDDRVPNRCINARTAEGLYQDEDKKKEITETLAKKENRCFQNPQEYGVELQKRLFRIRRLRQALRVAAEDAMTVSGFRNRFDNMADQSQEDYYHYALRLTADDDETAEGRKIPYRWGHVASYIMDDGEAGSDNIDAIRKAVEYDCDQAKRELRRNLPRGGGTEESDTDHEELVQELATLLTGGGSECTTPGTNCDNKLLRVLKILHRLYSAEREFQEQYRMWHDSYKGMLDKIEKDVRCRQHVDDPSLCRNLTCVDSAILWQMQSVSSLQHFGSCHIYLS